MHRTNLVSRLPLGLLIASLVLGDLGLPGIVRAQQMPLPSPVPGSVMPKAPAAFVAGVGDPIPSRPISATSDGIVLVQQPAQPELMPQPRPQGPASQGVSPDQLQQAPAPAPLPLPNRPLRLGETRQITLQEKRGRIQEVTSSNPEVAKVAISRDDPTVVLVQAGDKPGKTTITILPADKTIKAEEREILVSLTLEQMIKLAAPTANVSLTPGISPNGNPTLFVSGSVTNAEDINIINGLLEREVGRGNFTNAMRVGGVQQVQLDCVVALVSRTKLRAMSFDFLNQGFNHTLASTIGGAIVGPNMTIGNTPSAFIQTTLPPGNPNGFAPNIFLGLFNDQQLFYSYLQLLKQEQLAKLLAEPRLVTLSGHVATFLAGGQQAVPSPGGLGAVSVQFVPFGTQLNFLPVVLGNGKIYLEVSPSVSNLDNAAGSSIAGFFVAGRSTQTIHTSVLMEDGQTFVLGGLIQNQIAGSSQKVPVLGDLPWIGAAFRSESYREQENEVVVMVTPHLVDPLSCTQVPKLLPGQETRSPDDFELFLEGILEAPRGPRVICPDRHYKPAYKNGPAAAQFPCGMPGGCTTGGCGTACGVSGMGLADAASVSYPGNAPASTKEKPVVGAAPIAAAAATSTVGSSDSNAPAADKAGSADNAGTGKPVASPPLFGTTGDHGHK